MAVGWFGADIWDAVTDVATSVGDRALDVVRAVPGGAELADALHDVITGPLRDFAKTPYGMIVLRAMATTIYGPLAWEIGPQVASVAFAVPGLARGQDFWEAWFDEVRWRAETTAQIVGPGAADAALKPVFDKVPELSKLFPEGFDALPYEEIANRLGVTQAFTLDELAQRLGVSEWDAAMLRSLIFPDRFPIPRRSDYEEATGRLRPGARPPSKTSAAALRVSSVTGWEPPNVLWAKTSLAAGGATFANVLPPNSRPASSSRTPIEVGGAPPSARKTAQDVALVGVIAAAAGALAWWYTSERRRT